MKIEYMIIGALLFGLIFVLGLDIFSSLLSSYDVDVETDSTWGKMSYNAKEYKDQTESMRAFLQGGAVTDEDAVDEMISGGYSAIKNNPFTALGVAANASQTFMQETHMIPAEAISFLLLVLSILVIFAIIALIFRFQQR